MPRRITHFDSRSLQLRMLQKPRHKSARIRGGRLKNKIRRLLIQRLALGQQLIDARTGICGLQQRPRSILARTPENFIGTRAQVNHQAAILHRLSELCVQHSAAAGGQHNACTLRQFVKQPNLAPSEAFFTFDLENCRYRNAAARLQLAVRIDELIIQLLQRAACRQSTCRPPSCQSGTLSAGRFAWRAAYLGCEKKEPQRGSFFSRDDLTHRRVDTLRDHARRDEDDQLGAIVD